MTDDLDYGYDPNGDTDPNNLPGGGAGQDATAGDGLPGWPVADHPGLRAGVFGSGNGLLGMIRVGDAGGAAGAGGADAGSSAAQGGIDWDFIHQNEAVGAPKASMSIPQDRQGNVVGRSGPTIGYGFDVGQNSVDDLKRLGLSPSLIDALAPYTQMQGSAAKAYVQAHPLTLGPVDIDAIDQAVQQKMARDLASKFDAASQVGAFASLPSNTQTTIADLYHQYGTGDPAAAAPNFWRQVTGGDWQGAYDNLQDFHDLYRSRRKAEAELLKQDMDAGILPSKAGR